MSPTLSNVEPMAEIFVNGLDQAALLANFWSFYGNGCYFQPFYYNSWCLYFWYFQSENLAFNLKNTFFKIKIHYFPWFFVVVNDWWCYCVRFFIGRHFTIFFCKINIGKNCAHDPFFLTFFMYLQLRFRVMCWKRIQKMVMRLKKLYYFRLKVSFVFFPCW